MCQCFYRSLNAFSIYPYLLYSSECDINAIILSYNISSLKNMSASNYSNYLRVTCNLK